MNPEIRKFLPKVNALSRVAVAAVMLGSVLSPRLVSANETSPADLPGEPGSSRTYELPKGRLYNPRVMLEGQTTTHITVGQPVELCVNVEDLKGTTVSVKAAGWDSGSSQWDYKRSFAPMQRVVEDEEEVCFPFTKKGPTPAGLSNVSQAEFSVDGVTGASMLYTTE